MSMEKGTRTRLTTALILFLVLVSGSVLGVAVDRSLEARGAASGARGWGAEARRSDGERRERGEEGGDASRRRSLIVEQVGLSEGQKARVDSIVGHYRQRMRELQEEVQAELQAAYTPRYRELLEETRWEIKGVLTVGQQAVYDSLLVEHDRRREQRSTRDTLPDPKGRGGS